MGVTREGRESSAALTAVPSSSAARSAASAASSSTRKVKDRGARFNEKHALKYGLSICSRNAKDQSVEMVMCKFCVAFGKESATDAPRKRRATANIKYFRAPFRADHYLSHLEINHKTKWDEYEHATMPEKELFFAANADPAALAPPSVVAMAAAAIEANQVETGTDKTTPANETSVLAETVEGPETVYVSRVVPVRLPASEIEKDVVEILVGELFFNGQEEDGVTKDHALELFVSKEGSPNYEICIKNQRLYDLAIKFVANGASYRLASRLVYCVREETKLAHYGGCTDVRVANYVRAVLASNLQRLAWMMRAAWTYAIATETVQHQHTSYLDVRVRLWHNSGLRDFHLLAIPRFDHVPPSRVIDRLRTMLDILDPRWRVKLLGTTAHGGLHTGRDRGVAGNQQGLAARLTGLVQKPNFYLVWSAVHQLEVVTKNAVTALADKTFYEELVAVVQVVRRTPSDETRLPNKEELSSLPTAHASPRGFVQTLMTALRWLLRNRAAVSTLLESNVVSFQATRPRATPAWWVCAAAAQRVVAEVEYFIQKLTSMDAHEASVHDQVQELGKLALVMKDVVGATRDFVDFLSPPPCAESSAETETTPSTPTLSSPSVVRGSFILSLHSTEQFIQNEGGSVAIEMFDQVDGLERSQLARTVAEFAVDLLSAVAVVAHEGRHYCAESTQIVVTPPRVMPFDVYQMGKEDFMNLVAAQVERLRETFSPPEIRRIQNEYFFFLAAVETEPILSGVLKKHGRDTDVSFAWSCLNSRFLYLQEFIGGLASVVPDAMSGTLHAELLYLNWEKPDYRLTSVDFALEGILHARQKMQIEIVDVNHMRAALRASMMVNTDDPNRPAVAIDTATPAGGSVITSLASAEEVDDPMNGGHEEEVPLPVETTMTEATTTETTEAPNESNTTVSTDLKTPKKPTRLGEGYTIVVMKSYYILVAGFASFVSATDSFTGRATTYGLVNAIGGSCSVRLAPEGLDSSLFVAMNGDQYESSSACSRCLTIKGPKGTVTTFVADVCFECGHGNLDLNTALWNTIIGGDPRVEQITWSYTPCPDEKEKFCMKEGSNAQWLALQVANSRDGIKAMEIGGKKAEVIGITSFYQVSGGVNLDLSKLDVKITSTSGMTSKVTLNSATSFEGCAMPSNDDNHQSNANNNGNNGGTTTTVTVDVTGVTKDLNAWRAYRRRHSQVY